MSNVQDMTADIENLPAPTLEQLERQLTAALYAIWAAQKKDKIISNLRKDEISFEQRRDRRK